MTETTVITTEWVECAECGGEKLFEYVRQGDSEVLVKEECETCQYKWEKPKPDPELKSAIGRFMDRFLKRIRGKESDDQNLDEKYPCEFSAGYRCGNCANCHRAEGAGQ